MIIFDEKKYAEYLILNGYKNIKYIAMDNIILVKYWKSIGLEEVEIKNKLRSFMGKFQDLFNDSIINYKLNSAMKVGMKYDLLTAICVDITQDEIDQILLLEEKELQKMMFVLLFVWKFRCQPKRFKLTNTDLMSLSGVKVNNNTFWDYMHKITQKNLVTMVGYKNKSYYQVNMVSDGDTVLHIDKFDNVIYYFMHIIEPEKYPLCAKCNTPFSLINNSQKYCSTCAKEVENENHKIRNREHMRRKRSVDETEKP